MRQRLNFEAVGSVDDVSRPTVNCSSHSFSSAVGKGSPRWCSQYFKTYTGGAAARVGPPKIQR